MEATALSFLSDLGITLKGDFQSVLRTLESLSMFFLFCVM